jgi:hypothetical protein
VVALLLWCPTALPDEPVIERRVWQGTVGHFLNGTPLAVDTDGDGNVDSTLDWARFNVTAGDVPASCSLMAAILYWGGSQRQPIEACSYGSDSEVTLVLPAGDTLAVGAEERWCSDGGSTSYDIWLCRSDITGRIGGRGADFSGAWSVGGYTGRIADNTTDNASAALLLVYSDASLGRARVVLHDGLMVMQSDSTVLAIDRLQVSDPAFAWLTYYTLEGDPGSSASERVTIGGHPGGKALQLADAVNPSTNPMNHSINTVTPADTLAVGVDIDTYDVTGSLPPGDTSAYITYSAGTDKWWLAASVVTIGYAQECLIVTMSADLNQDGAVDYADLIYLARFVLMGGASPLPCLANGDVDCNGRVATSDVVYLANYVLRAGPQPCDACRNRLLPCR